MNDESFGQLPFLDKVAYSFLTSIPKDLTPAERDAIKKASILGACPKRVALLLGTSKERKRLKVLENSSFIPIRYSFTSETKVVDWQAFFTLIYRACML
jgi:hypothetical protein